MDLVKTRKQNQVMTICLADRENRNALSQKLVEQLLCAINDAQTDGEIRVVVLTNSGPVFCAGADLKSNPSNEDYGTKVVKLFKCLADSPKPIVGRINGHCLGGGLGLLAATDIAIGLETAKLGFTEVRVGVAPAIISVLCLPKMALTQASDAFLRGKLFLAPEAVKLGLLNAAVPTSSLDEAVKQVVDDLLLGEPNALAACKSLLRQVPNMSRDDAFAWAAQLSAKLFASDEAQEGMRAFLEKRKPYWVTEPS